mmetsp:Transcript_34054/g.82596  ORF Transcript_34054/g.82596 Transcript_34054/m.82596 type:complete len:433 (+) Transcript_34054:181-1479(+)
MKGSCSQLARCALFCLFMSRLHICSAYAEQWWTSSEASWKPVSSDYNWSHRRTGTRPDWSPYFGNWLHYRPSELLSNDKSSNIVIEGKHVRPWTVGRMCKFLRQKDDSGKDEAFELKSIYEESAKGDWAKGFIEKRINTADREDDVPLWQLGHIFNKTPYRVTALPCSLPPKLEGVGAESSRVTIVMPDGCTVSGPRWLPTNEEADELQQWKDKDGKNAMRFQFCELWLAEGTAESTKVGAFVMYDGITGELVQIFRMKEVLLPNESGDDPEKGISMDQLESTIDDKSRLIRKDIVDADMLRALRCGESLDNVFQQSHFTSFAGRAVRCSSPNGAEEECTTNMAAGNDGASNIVASLLAPKGKEAQHIDIRFEDGVYLRVPKSFCPGTFADDAEVCLELGSLRLDDGGFHRVRMTGCRKSGGFDVCAYERWQ